MNFEHIDDNHQRAKVFGGWLVKAFESVCHESLGIMEDGYAFRVAMTFVPDPNHEWTISDDINDSPELFEGTMQALNELGVKL